MKRGRPVPTVCVVGSFMMDLVLEVSRRPAVGETIVGKSFGMFPGGKGCNQAIAAARTGAQTTMIGRVGSDDFGKTFRRTLAEEHIDSQYVVDDPTEGTGVGCPVVDEAGSNSIVIVPRANTRVSLGDIDAAVSAIEAADILMFQLETPVAVSLKAAKLACRAGSHTKVMFNPAPMQPFDEELLAYCHFVVLNEIEAAQIAGVERVSSQADAKAAAALVLPRCLQPEAVVIITLGSLGCVVVPKVGATLTIHAFSVPVVDTTAAGDAFCGALATALAEGQDLKSAIRFANGGGALAVTVLGASPSLPTRSKLDAFLARPDNATVQPSE